MHAQLIWSKLLGGGGNIHWIVCLCACVFAYMHVHTYMYVWIYICIYIGVYMYLIQSHHKKMVIILGGASVKKVIKEKKICDFFYRLAHGGIVPAISSWFDQKSRHSW